jgi:hypothetical protein
MLFCIKIPIINKYGIKTAVIFYYEGDKCPCLTTLRTILLEQHKIEKIQPNASGNYYYAWKTLLKLTLPVMSKDQFHVSMRCDSKLRGEEVIISRIIPFSPRNNVCSD